MSEKKCSKDSDLIATKGEKPYALAIAQSKQTMRARKVKPSMPKMPWDDKPEDKDE